MGRQLTKLLLFPVIFLLLAIPAVSSPVTHFKFTAMTGTYMVVIIQASIKPMIHGMPLEKGDEIGAFTPAGLCVGATIWDGVRNTYIAVWQDNEYTPVIDGIRIAEPISYRIWSCRTKKEYAAAATYNTNPASHATSAGSYVIDGISILASLKASGEPISPAPSLVSPEDTATITADSAAFQWTRGDSGTDRYLLEIAEDSLMSKITVADTIADTTACRKGLTKGMTYWWRIKYHKAAKWETGGMRTFNVVY